MSGSLLTYLDILIAQKEEKERQERREVLPGGAGVVPAVREPEAGDRGAGAGADRAR